MAPPNVIFITVEGMRWNDLGALGNPLIRTPNLDALAGHGVTFTQALIDHCPTQKDTVASAVEARPTASTPASRLGSLLQQAGYQCNAVGSIGSAPEGFDWTAHGDGEQLDDDYGQWRAQSTGPSKKKGGAETNVKESLHVTTWIGNQAVRVCQSGDEPVYLWVAFPSTRNAPLPWRNMYASLIDQLDDTDTSEEREYLDKSRLIAHYGAISHLDRQIGRMLATLTARGRTNNVFIFTATQGLQPESPHDDSPCLGCFREAAVRVPLIVGGLLGQRHGETDTALISTADIPDTVLDALVANKNSVLRKNSFLAQLRRAGVPHRRAVVIEGTVDTRAVRTPRYKWIVNEKDGSECLFDLQSDPSEHNNLSNTQRALAIRKMLSGLTQD